VIKIKQLLLSCYKLFRIQQFKFSITSLKDILRCMDPWILNSKYDFSHVVSTSSSPPKAQHGVLHVWLIELLRHLILEWTNKDRHMYKSLTSLKFSIPDGLLWGPKECGMFAAAPSSNGVTSYLAYGKVYSIQSSCSCKAIISLACIIFA
jgi:hypothetical protein